MSEIQLNKNEHIVAECKVNKAATVLPISMIVLGFALLLTALVLGIKTGKLIFGVLLAIPALCFLFIPGFIALAMVMARKLVMTNKRVIGKVGLFNTTTLDSPLSKIDSVMVSHSFFGDKFNYSCITIRTNSSNGVRFGAMTDADNFRNILTEAIEEEAEKARLAQAAAISSALNSSNKNN